MQKNKEVDVAREPNEKPQQLQHHITTKQHPNTIKGDSKTVPTPER